MRKVVLIMPKSSTDKNTKKEVEIPKKVLKNMEEKLPDDIREQILALGRKEKINHEKYLEELKKLPKEKRWYAIIPMLYFTNENKIAERILVEILEKESYAMKRKIITFLTHRENEEFKKKIPTYLENENEVLKAAAIWAMAFMGIKNNLYEKAVKLYPKTKKDQARLYLIAALYHMNKKPESEEMKFLKELYKTKYYDSKEKKLIVYDEPEYNLSTVFLNDILQEIGIETINIDNGKIMEIYKHLLEDTG